MKILSALWLLGLYWFLFTLIHYLFFQPSSHGMETINFAFPSMVMLMRASYITGNTIKSHLFYVCYGGLSVLFVSKLYLASGPTNRNIKLSYANDEKWFLIELFFPIIIMALISMIGCRFFASLRRSANTVPDPEITPIFQADSEKSTIIFDQNQQV